MRGTYWFPDRSIYSRGLAPSWLYTNLLPLRSIQIDQSTSGMRANEIRWATVPSSLLEMIFLMNWTGGFDYDISLQCIVGDLLCFWNTSGTLFWGGWPSRSLASISKVIFITLITIGQIWDQHWWEQTGKWSCRVIQFWWCVCLMFNLIPNP